MGPQRRRTRETCSHPKCSTGRSIVGTMTRLTWLTRTMSLRSSLASQENTQRLSRPRRNQLRRAKMRPSQQRVKPRKEKQLLLKVKLHLQKEKLRLLLLQRKLHLRRSREMCDTSSYLSQLELCQSHCHPIASSLGEYLLRFSCV